MVNTRSIPRKRIATNTTDTEPNRKCGKGERIPRQNAYQSKRLAEQRDNDTRDKMLCQRMCRYARPTNENLRKNNFFLFFISIILA